MLDKWADPVEVGDAEMAALRLLLKNTDLETRNIRMTFDANRDRWDPTIFHRRWTSKAEGSRSAPRGVGSSAGDTIPRDGWGTARWYPGHEFLTLLRSHRHIDRAFILFSQLSVANSARYVGPARVRTILQPGRVGDTGGAEQSTRRAIDDWYERFPDCTISLFEKDASIQLKELKVYHGVYAEGEYIPFTDAELFALY
ncbi:hypothetical protein ACHAWF_004080 [Thalassiosira exigua]